MVASGGVTRRSFLSLTGSALAAGALAACGSNTGRSGASASGSAGARPKLSQWYHQYGETGTQQAVQRYAKGYSGADVSIQWIAGDYDKRVSAALLTQSGPDVFEGGNGPSIDQIQSGQVVPLDGVLGDAADDFTKSLVDRMTYQGKLYGVPQVIDMQLLVYRKSLLDKAHLQPPQTFAELMEAAKALTTKDVKGLFVGNDGGVGVLPGPLLWSVGADYLTADNKVGFDDPQVATAFGQLHQLFTSGSLLLGAPTDWSDPSAFTQGLTAMQWTGLWTFPQLQQAFPDDFGVLPWPKFSDSVGAPSVPIGAYGSAVSAKSKNVDAAKAFVKWLWVDQTEDQLDFAQSYGFHVPARKSLADKADKLKSGPAADAVKLLQTNGRAQTPLLWTPASGTALSDAASRIIKNGADPAGQLRQVMTTVNAELKRVAK
jgi:multiple sugar transport system substrate-binding protein